MVNSDLPLSARGDSKALRWLLMFGAGALLIIVLTLANAANEAWTVSVDRGSTGFCGMSVQHYNAMPEEKKHRFHATCVNDEDMLLR